MTVQKAVRTLLEGNSVIQYPRYQVGFPKGLTREQIREFFPDIGKVLDELDR